MSTCTSCGASIVWARSAKTGKPMPLDPEPTSNGNIELRAGTAYYVKPDHNAVPSRYVSHFTTCPQANEHRKSRS